MAVMTPRPLVTLLVLVGLGFPPTPAFAGSPNVNVLWRLLAPANLMLMVGNVCLAQDPSFLTRTMGSHGDFRAYAQAVKDEVSEGVPPEDLLLILRRAADAAKAEALADIRDLEAADPETERQNTEAWCKTSATSIVNDLLVTHDLDHDGFERLLSAAKSSSLGR